MDTKKTIKRNSFIMASGTLASRLTGQGRTILLAAALGVTGVAANAYQVGGQIPHVIFNLIEGGLLNAVLVPQIVRAFKKKS
ncbi:MAG: lipid II flippase MurJ, partial [Aeriscardovia sp.]|nr:lipid II flippase MurJ [Aeriscardovia sp.]